MKISIITASFNQGTFLRRALQSILDQQGNFTIEMIVMDGGSRDESVEIIKEFETKSQAHPHISYSWVSQKDGGQSDAMNQGLKKATGDIAVCLNSDDMLTPGALQKVADAFSDEKVTWAAGYTHIINENDTIIQKPITLYKNWLLKNYSLKKLLFTNFIPEPATYWRTSVMKEIGYFDESLHYCMDYEYALRLAHHSEPYIIKDYLSFFRIHKSSKSGAVYKQQFRDDYLTAKRYATSKPILFLHWLHNKLIVGIYSIIK